MIDPFQVVRDFESALCEYTGAPYAVATTSCTMALLLAVAWNLRDKRKRFEITVEPGKTIINGDMYYGPAYKTQAYIEPASPKKMIDIPKRTYVGVPMSIIHAGGRPTFRDEDWSGCYQLKPLPIWDCARWLTKDIYHELRLCGGGFKTHPMICLSFHWTKHLAIGQGGAILHDDPVADKWLRKARFDGRTEGVSASQDTFDMIGFHAYMMPRDAAEGLTRLALLPRHNEPLPNSDYHDLSLLPIFK